MESRFADLRRRDSSVSMLRVKQSRRRSQSQKENRERMVNTRRQLDKLPELELSSLDASVMTTNMSTIQEKTQSNAKSAKTLDRLKRLESWKEQKALKKEKERRERESKGVFKIGLYQPKDTFSLVPLPVVPPSSTIPKEKKVNTAPSQSTRVTRSMKRPQQEPQKRPNTLAGKVPASADGATRGRAAPVKPAAAATKSSTGCHAAPGPALATRSANRPPVTKAPGLKGNPKAKAADVRVTRNRVVVNPLSLPAGGKKSCKAASIAAQPDVHKKAEIIQTGIQEQETSVCPPRPGPEEEEVVVEEAAPAVGSANPSFAPEGFVFQAPAGLSSFKFEPLTPRSADAFLTPSNSFNLPPPPVFSGAPPAEPGAPPAEPGAPPAPQRPSLHTPPPSGLSSSGSPQESKHDVPYFRSEISSERGRLTNLCLHWESRVEDESIPEEMRDRMRTAIGQARLLMKERFKQFSGLVDDCELGRGEKITTCSDLQGFWDMVYFQVEDVNKKFDALTEAEGRGWVEEEEPPPRQRKAVKKTAAAPAKQTGNKAAAKSRLAAVKAAMKARQQAGRAAKDAERDDGSRREPQAESQTVVFDGGFFQVESPAKPSVRRSSRLSAAGPHASPRQRYLSPRRATRRSLGAALTRSPAQPLHAAEQRCLTLEQTPGLKSQRGPPLAFQKTGPGSLSAGLNESNQSPQHQSEGVSKQEEATVVPDLLAVSAGELDNKPLKVISDVPPLSPRLSLSPCKAAVLQTPPRPSALSFSLSPEDGAGPMETQRPVSPTPDGSVIEEISGLDFERYLQPSQRCSLSPRDAVAMEMLPSMGADVEMESPKGQPGDLLSHLEPALSTGSSLLTLQSPQVVQTAESAMLLFTPELKDRIRQSSCPSDLMVFTPPNI